MRRPPTTLAIATALGFLQVVAVRVALHLQQPTSPILYTDEAGFLTAAWHFSTRGGAAVLPRSQLYSPGYPLLISPLLSIFDGDAWRLAVLFNVMCAALIPIVLWRFAVDVLRLDAGRSAVTAFAGGLYPAILIQSSRAWPEVLLALLTAVWAYAAGRYLADGDRRFAIVAATVAGLSYVVHHRTAGWILVTVLMFCGPIAWRWYRTRSVDRTAIVTAALGAGITVAGLLISRALDQRLEDAIYLTPPRDFAARVRSGLKPSGLGATFERAIGQVWYAQVATLGLLGVVVVATIVGRRHHRAFLVTLTLAFAATMGIASAFLTGTNRLDHFVYGRYNEIWAPVIVTTGLALLLDASRALRITAIASAASPVLLTGLIVAINGNDFFTGNFNKITIPVASAWDLVEGDRNQPVTERLDVWVIGLAAAAVGCAAAFLVIRFRERAVAAYAAVFLTLGAGASTASYRPWFDIFESNGVTAARVFAESGEERLGYVFELRVESRNGVQYQAGFPELLEVEPAGGCPDVGLVIAPSDTSFGFAVSEVLPLEPFGGTMFSVDC